MADSHKNVRSQIDGLTDSQIAGIGRVLAEPRRVQMLREIAAFREPMPCARLRQSRGVSSATLSHHIKQLETAGLIEIARKGMCASVMLQRDVLRAYVDRVSTI
jgi:ArsR family transcriptional regulator, arsenate/arsenite/antimonite-responsive transcriptional repressor